MKESSSASSSSCKFDWIYYSYILQITEDTRRKRENVSKTLREDLLSKTKNVAAETRIYISLPKTDDHEFHLTGTVSMLSLSIYMYVGVTSQRQLQQTKFVTI